MSNIYELPRATLADVPCVLRAIADGIEAGQYGRVEAAVVVVENDAGKLNIFGAGAADYYRGIAILGLAAHSIKRERLERV